VDVKEYMQAKALQKMIYYYYLSYYYESEVISRKIEVIQPPEIKGSLAESK